MAFLHTNFLTGNDTTGDGTTALPYKTIQKALGVAVSSDFIKVAGGQWSSALAGTFTFTNDSQIITTSVSQVGTVLVDDVLSFDDGQYGFDHFHIKVIALTTTTITTTLVWALPTVTVSDVKRIETYHYSGSVATPNETWSTSATLPTGRTGITISGGWSNDYTTQGGWTVCRTTGSVGTQGTMIQTPSSAIGGFGDWKENLYWDKFLFHSRRFYQMGAGTTSVTTNQSMSLGNFAFLNGGFAAVENVQSGIGIWQQDPAVPIVFYKSSESISTGFSVINANSNANRPDAIKIELWATISSLTPGGVTTTNRGLGMLSTGTFDGSINQVTYHERSNYTSSGLPTANRSFNRGGYYDEINIYANAPTSVTIPVDTGVYQFNKFNTLGAFADQFSIFINTSRISPEYQIIVALPTQTLDSVKPGNGGNLGATQVGQFGRITQGGISNVTVIDQEGLKTMDIFDNIYFKNAGILKIGSNYTFSNSGQVYDIPKLIGVFEKPVVPFTVSFTLKVDAGAEAQWNKLLIMYGPNANQIIEQALVPTDAFATYTITVDPADYGDWTKFQFPIYLGIQARSANSFLEETMTYCYIQSVTIV